MSNFIGHIHSRLDTKGRLLFPAAFKKQLSAQSAETFVLKKDIYEQCLILYPKDTWQQMVQQLQQKLNPYNRQHNMFLRKFFMDTAELTLDANNRLLLPKRLLDMVQIDRDIILIGAGNKIELWNPQLLEQTMIDDQQFTELAQQILANTDFQV